MKKQMIELTEGIRSNADEFGGKGNSLLKLINAGYSVPHGFIIPTYCFIDTLKENNVYERIKNICKNITIDNFQENSAILQNLIMRCDVSLKIAEQAQRLGSSVSVRSSAVSEDGSSYSFAGLHDSFLNVNKNNIDENVKKVWVSLFNDRAIYYRLCNNLTLFEGMAVIVQNMINAKCSGVVFTQHPIDQNYILVEIASGTRDNVVGGIITPNRYLFDRQTLKLVSSELTTEPLLDDKTLEKLVIKSMDIEKLFDKPQDIEWVFDDILHFLQSRAVVFLTIDSKIIELEKEHVWKKYVSRRMPLLWVSFSDSSATRESWLRYTGEDIFVTFKSCEHGKWADTEEIQRAKQLIKSKVKRDIRSYDGFCDSVRNKCMNACNEFLTFCIENSRNSYTQLSNAVLTAIFREYCEKNLLQLPFFNILRLWTILLRSYLPVKFRSLALIFVMNM
ncbi:MAG: PEP/pyruvate-binding domain-containing protein [Fibromonadaceae bacterium]|jgi:pyruvate,water dikinase|nr:PEP/pyruvate-binding domain-containing protein [Fibromonadaceae bacterium]